MKHFAAMLLLMLSLAFLLCAAAEEAADASLAPPQLRQISSIEEAEAFLLYPPEDGVSGVQAGFIRLIAQHRANDPMFRKQYWLGGEEGGDFDLTLQKNRNGREYNFHAGNMCTRAAYSMALSYLGVDVTPGDMTALTGRRDLNPPYDKVSELFGVELIQPRSYIFDTMVENYLNDPSYSPVYVYLQLPNGQQHSLLVIGKLPEKSRYIVLDPSGIWLYGQQHRVYMMSFNKTRAEVVNSTFRVEYAGSRVLKLYQWRLLPQEEAPAP